MAQTGVTLVRLAEFAWCRLEPEDGSFDFSWLDDAIGLFQEHGIDVVIGTPTNCPPRWLCEAEPSILPVGNNGQANPIGIRGHRCYNSPVLREYAGRIVRKLAEHYKETQAVVAWQIDNELEANICYCEVCNEKHRRWLKEKYGTLEALNQAYGNVVWSGEYSAWEQIDPPYGGYNTAWLNPAYMLDYRRRTAEDVTEFSNFQADIIRSVIPHAQITTNTWFCENMPDYYKLFEKLDAVSYDNYPTAEIPENPEEIYTHAVHLDFMRGIKRQNFWVMEQLSGGMGCWMPMKKMPRPGMIQGYALQAFAHGADTVVHFRWRTATIGAEMHWHGLLDHSNVPGRRFREFAELCKTAKTLEACQGTTLRSDVAILYSNESEYAFKLQPQTDGMSYMEQIKLVHQAFARFGVNVDIIGEHEDLSGYKIVCAPALYIVDEGTVQRLYEFAKSGGTVVLTVRSGVKDARNNCIMAQLPTVYAELTGCHVEEYDPIGYSQAKLRVTGDWGHSCTGQMDHAETDADTEETACERQMNRTETDVDIVEKEVFNCGQWCDILKEDTAETIAVYDSEFYKGSPAVTVNRYGEGYAYYIGTVAERKLYERLAEKILSECKVPYYAELPANVEVTTRTGNGKTIRFVFNNADQMQTFSFEGQEISLQPFEMKIKEEGE